MLQKNPWDEDWSAPQGGGPVTVGTPDRYKASEEERKRRENQRQDEELRLRREAEARAAGAAGRDAAKDALTIDKAQADQRNRAVTGGLDYSVEQGKAASFYKRALESNTAYSRLGVGPRGYLESKAADLAPDLINQRDDATRQVSETEMRNFISAALRYESGAVISPSEFENHKRIFFPAPGDSPENIAAKEKARKDAIDGLRIGAGPAAALVGQPEALSEQDVQQQLTERLKKGESIGSLVKWLTDNGRPPTPEQIDAMVKNIGYQKPDVRTQGADYLRRLHMGVGDVAEGLGDTLGLVSNPLNAGINWATGANLGTDLGQSLRDLTGAPQPQTSAENFASAINRGGTGALGFAGAARGAAPYLQGVAQAGARTIAGAPMLDAVGGVSGGLSGEAAKQAGLPWYAQLGASVLGGAGGVAGASRLGQRLAPMAPPQVPPVVQAGRAENIPVPRAMVDPRLAPKVSAADGTMLGRAIIRDRMGNVQDAIGQGVDRLGQGGTSMNTNVGGQMIQDVAQRSIRQSGSAASRMYDAAAKAAGGVKLPANSAIGEIDSLIGRLSETPSLNQREIDFLQGIRDDLTTAVGKDANMIGAPPRSGVSPANVAKNGKVYIGPPGGTHFQVAEMYPRVKFGGDTGFVNPLGQYMTREEALAWVNANGERIRPSDNMPGQLDALDYRDQSRNIGAGQSAARTPKGISVEGLRDLRTSLRQKISKGELTFGQNEARVLGIMDAASQDIAAGLGAAGKKGVAQQFAKADAFYRDRMEFIQGTVQKLIGRRNSTTTPEQVFANFRAMASPRGNEAGLGRMIREMKPEEQADIAATLADGLGKNAKGEFSTAHLVSQAAKLPRAAKVNVFGPDGARSLDNLVALAREHARVSQAYNHSNTSVGNDFRSYALNVLFGSGTGASTGSPMAGVATGLAGIGAKTAHDFVTARSVMSTDLTNWLKSLPRTNNPQVVSRYMDRLAGIAARNPALQAEAQALQQRIMAAANENYGGLSQSAASGRDEEERRNNPRRY